MESGGRLMMNGVSKISYLDSLRGLAAVVVVASHFACAFFPYAVLGDRYQSLNSMEDFFHYPPLATALAGHFAVCLFFVLSGFVLSIGTIERRAQSGLVSGSPASDGWNIAKASIKRPVRLGGLVVASLAMGYLLLICNLYSNQTVGLRSGSTPWFTSFWIDQPSLSEFLRDLLLCPFTEGEKYNPPLWTIKKELVGSYLVFAYLLVTIGQSRLCRKFLLVALIMFFFRTLYVGFILGLVLAELHVGRFPASPASPIDKAPGKTPGHSWWLGLLLLFGVLLSGKMHYVPFEFEGPFANVQRLFLQDFGTGSAAMVAAFLVFFVVLHSGRLQRILRWPFLCYLGRISYALYALHFLLLGSLSCSVYLAFEPSAGHELAVTATVLITVACLIPAAHLLTVTVDSWSIAISGLIADKVLLSTRRLGTRLVGKGWRKYSFRKQGEIA